jgi:hypothetical protein
METRQNGTRYKDYSLWESTKQTPYDYERNGLVNKIVSKPIANTDNPVLKFILGFYESSIVFLLKNIDILKHFKDVHWKNR